MRNIHYALLVSAGALCACEPSDYSDPPESVAPCCHGVGMCVFGGPTSEETKQRLPQTECEAPAACIPVDWVLDPLHGPANCRAPGDLEGRCLPRCLPELSDQTHLQRQTCEDDYLCVPCFDPFTGADTQACRFDMDPGPSETPRVPDACCAGTGQCLSHALLEASPMAEREDLQRGDCAADLLCVPITGLARGQALESMDADCFQP